MRELGEQVADLLARTSASQNEMLLKTHEALQGTLDDTTTRGMLMAGGAVLLGLVLSVLLARGIAGPVTRLTAAMGSLAEGRLDTPIPARDRQDELGAMARALEVFRDGMREAAALRTRQAVQAQEAEAARRAALRALADGFEARVGQLVGQVAEAATGLRATASTMEGTAQQTTGQSATVASAAEQASVNVQTVAVAAEQLSVSTTEISRQVAQSATIAAPGGGGCAAHRRGGAGAGRRGAADRRRGEPDQQHRRADQPAGAERHHRGGPRRRVPAAASRWWRAR